MIKDYESAVYTDEGKLKLLDNLRRIDSSKPDTLASRLDIISYKEILELGEAQDKINLIGMLSFTPIKENISLIREALDDEDEMVRILASTAMQKMDYFFQSQIHLLTKTLSNAKNDYITYFELAKIYDDYAYSGLIPNESLAYYQEKTLSFYSLAREFANDKKEITYGYLRALIRAKRLTKAKELLISTSAAMDDVFYSFWLAEIEFLEKNYKTVEDILMRLDKEVIKNPALYKSQRWWGQND